jgi:hypothetical protein
LKKFILTGFLLALIAPALASAEDQVRLTCKYTIVSPDGYNATDELTYNYILDMKNRTLGGRHASISDLEIEQTYVYNDETYYTKIDRVSGEMSGYATIKKGTRKNFIRGICEKSANVKTRF